MSGVEGGVTIWSSRPLSRRYLPGFREGICRGFGKVFAGVSGRSSPRGFENREKSIKLSQDDLKLTHFLTEHTQVTHFDKADKLHLELTVAYIVGKHP